jgi:osmotically-inducible protein OsmY
MRFNRVAARLAIIGLFSAAVAVPGFTQETAQPNADNTKVNKRDRSKSEPTADQGKNNQADRELMRNIRRALLDDKSLSSYAHNAKVIAQGGKVTLKGPVRSEEERRAVEEKATAVAGQGNVTNNLTVKAARAHK